MVNWRRPGASLLSKNTSPRRAKLESAKTRAGVLLEQGDPEAALALLEPFEDEFPNDWELLFILGSCLFGLGDIADALDYFEDAYAQSKDPVVLYPLGMAYLQLNMLGSALHSFEESLRRRFPLPEELEPTVDLLRSQMEDIARELGLPTNKTIPGFRDMERAARLIDQADYPGAIAASRAAIKVLGNWPPPHLDLADALFNDGQSTAAIAELHQLLARDPEHIHAASTLVRFLTWTGDRPAAEKMWESLRTRTPVDLPFDAVDLAEAAAILDYDEDVRRFLLPLADRPRKQYVVQPSYALVQRFLSIADANLGDTMSAKRRLRALKDEDPHVPLLRKALRSGQTSLGLNGRFSYYTSLDVMQSINFEEFTHLALALGENPEDLESARALTRFIAKFPQLVLLGEKQIWEEDSVANGINLLRLLGTPAAHAALRRFAGSQAGSDEDRRQALTALQLNGGAKDGEHYTLWQDGAWQEVELRGFTIGPRNDHPPYKAKAQKLLNEGEVALSKERWADGAALMRQVIELEPRAYEAYNNLAVALGRMGDTEAGIAFLEQALVINPNYLFARVSLALNLANTDPAAAGAVLAPLEPMTHFTPPEFLYYKFGLAQVAAVQGDYAAARESLQMAFAYDPNYSVGLKLLAKIEDAEFGQHNGPVWDKARQRFEEKNARDRQLQQAKLATLTPTVSATIGIYTAEILRVIYRSVLPNRSLTKLRKADLQRQLIDSLPEPATITAMLETSLSAAERGALATVLAAGGAMPRALFRTQFGDDTRESPYWQYHAPTSVVGRLRLHCLLVETTVDDTVYLVIPMELRETLRTLLNA